MTHALSRFCCFTGVGIQFGVAVTLATATPNVLTLAFLNCEENTCHDSAHHTEKHTEIGQSEGFQHAYLLFGFTLARANARMLINAASKRSSAKNAVRTSRSRSP